MTSTTNSKKEVIDFLWEWAENQGIWAKLLLRNILSSSGCLSQQERVTIFQYFLQSIKLFSGLPPLAISKPPYSISSKSVKISRLSEVTGVNRLAKDQTIGFSPNLTVIYGENGTGKTGYSRILKALGFSYETSGTIHPNIYNPTKPPKSAKIDFETNGTHQSFTWTGSNRCNDLDTISVFNNHCVAISLSDRQLVVTPIGFELFGLVTDELNALAQLINTEKQKLPVTDWLALFLPGTPQHSAISKLSSKTVVSELTILAGFDDGHNQRLIAKTKELTGLNKALIEATIRELKLKISDIENSLTKIRKAESIINNKTWQEQHKTITDIAVLQKQSQRGLSEIVSSFSIEQYSSAQFLSFITAADAYLKLLAKSNYPAESDVCIYCQQNLDTPAKELLANYRVLLNDTTQQQINQLSASRNHFKAQMTYVDGAIKLAQASWGYDDEGTIKQPQELIEYNNTLSSLKKAVTDDNIPNGDLPLKYSTLLTAFEEKKQALAKELNSRESDLANIATKERQITIEINELKDRKILTDHLTNITTTIENLKKIDILNKNQNAFNTRSISIKTTEAREELVRQNFNAIFKTELAAFRKSHLNIDLNFATDRGNSKVQQRVKSHLLTEILSEGEQKAIALSEFLTELQLDNSKSTVIFDDPVNSLDHHLIDDYSRRAIALSKDRQVIIFTHSILLFNSLFYFRDKPQYKGIDLTFYNSRNEHEETGIISNAEEVNSVKSYIGKINILLSSAKSRPEAEMAEDGYGYLRSAIELCVENEILNNTVRRYQKNVALTQFIKINGQLLDSNKEQLNELFERCCGYIKGHSNPMEIHNEPTLQELKTDFETFKKLRTIFS
ncbi:AAA family ATPase [Mucilaginibacter ginsenosidivorax]|uniref:AAA family ATPase n=1 Tax=Mucilaginibacter ginsenosidivorax TaxID=862126 RepID=A0A5B8W372_9SPHI|nr:AAA family ATPase [Mucilaginibacter ginsenosidivorax]QEC77392.1 AAA family ATPase [Mucilaginibacter ginsenosidivorax]